MAEARERERGCDKRERESEALWAVVRKKTRERESDINEKLEI